MEGWEVIFSFHPQLYTASLGYSAMAVKQTPPLKIGKENFEATCIHLHRLFNIYAWDDQTYLFVSCHVDWIFPIHWSVEWISLAGCLQETFPCYLLQVRNKTFLTKTKTKHKHLSCQNFLLKFKKVLSKRFVSGNLIKGVNFRTLEFPSLKQGINKTKYLCVFLTFLQGISSISV